MDHYMFDQPVQLEVFPTDLHLRRIDPACNMRRFYCLSVQRDLFGGACLIREWGRIGQPSTVRETEFETEKAALAASAAVRQRKEKRGYWAVGG